jgi:hypothetical protein
VNHLINHWLQLNHYSSEVNGPETDRKSQTSEQRLRTRKCRVPCQTKKVDYKLPPKRTKRLRVSYTPSQKKCHFRVAMTPLTKRWAYWLGPKKMLDFVSPPYLNRTKSVMSEGGITESPTSAGPPTER